MRVSASFPGVVSHRPLPAVRELLTQGQIESEILRLSGLLEASTDEHGRAAEEMAAAEVAWKAAEAVTVLHSEQTNESKRKAEALVAHREEFAEWRARQAVLDAITERNRTLRAQLDALRTLSANVRNQT